jgi:hypothetical protein
MEKDLNYWKENAEEDYLKVPISVLRYISILEYELSKITPLEIIVTNSLVTGKVKFSPERVMPKPLPKETITGELRKSLLKLGKSSRYVYSDPRSDGKVGVKFTGVYLTELETTWLKNEMEGKGFKCHSIKENNTNSWTYCKGTRFTFYNK